MIIESTGCLPEDRISLGNGQLFYRLFETYSKRAKGTILILHGMKEHSGRYIEFARYLCENGYNVLCYDHLGHGRTATNHDQLGYIPSKMPALQLVNDAEYMFLHLKKRYPKLPHYAIGHSMGSFILRLLLQRVEDCLDGAVIVGTGGRNPAAVLGKGLIGIMNRMSPQKRSKFVNVSFDKMNNSKFKNEPGASDTSWLSLNKENRDAFDADELCGVPFSNNGFYALLTLNINATKKGWTHPIHKTLPLFFVSGGDDPIGNFGKGIKKTVDCLKDNGFVDVSMKLYDGMRHEILNEDIRQEVYNDILNWLNEHQKY